MAESHSTEAVEKPSGTPTVTDPAVDARSGVLCAEHDGATIGYLVAQDLGPRLRSGYRDRQARFHDLYVTAEHRGLGAGTALMNALIEWVRPRVTFLEWQAHEERAAPCYERLGYRGDPCPQPEYPRFEIVFERHDQGSD